MLSENFISETGFVGIGEERSEIELRLTEAGSVDVKLKQEAQIQNDLKVDEDGKVLDEHPEFRELEGELASGEDLKLSGVLFKKTSKFGVEVDMRVTDIKEPTEVLIDSGDWDSIVDKRVTLEIDMMCCTMLPPIKYRIQLIQQEDWSLWCSPSDDIKERIDEIKKYKTPIRTATLELEQEVNGTPEVQIREAMDKVTYLAELMSFAQGVLPTPIRVRITKIDGQTLEDRRYEKWITNYQTDIGHAFKERRICWGGDMKKFLNEAYEPYVNEVREDYCLKIVLSWYLDGLNATRTIDSQIASFCSGIELLAKRHSDLGPNHSSTEERIKHLVNTLDVETEDLAEFSATFDDSSGKAEEYFHHYIRQYVVHGDNLNQVGVEELVREREACLRLMQRLLRNQLIDQDSLDDYAELSELEPEYRFES